jgi:hypothetical protein
MKRRNESFSEILLKSPWWVSVVLGMAAFAGLCWGLHTWWGDNKTFLPFETAASNLAPVVALFFVVMAGFSFWLEKRWQTLVDQQTSLESLRAVSWRDFEFLVAEAYRRQGYAVDFSLGKRHRRRRGLDITQGEAHLVGAMQAMKSIFRGCPGDSRDVRHHDGRTGRRGNHCDFRQIHGRSEKFCSRKTNSVGGRPAFAETGKTGARSRPRIKHPVLDDSRPG